MPRKKDTPSPRLSMKAEKALSAIDTQRYEITDQLEDLSEAELKAVADYARKDGRVYPFWTGVAAAAEQRLELLERYRTGRGKWVALVEAIDWDPTSNLGNSRILAKAECGIRSEAVTEAKKLLAEHIDDLGETTRIVAYVVSELHDEIRELEASQEESPSEIS